MRLPMSAYTTNQYHTEVELYNLMDGTLIYREDREHSCWCLAPAEFMVFQIAGPYLTSVLPEAPTLVLKQLEYLLSEQPMDSVILAHAREISYMESMEA